MPRASHLFRLLQRLGWFYSVMLLVAFVAVGGVAGLAEEAIEQDTRAVNERILLAIHAQAHPVGDALALACAAIGSLAGILFTGALFGVWLATKQRWLDVVTLTAALIGGAALTFALKASYQYARPELFPRLTHELTYSFPSGHASMSMCLYGFLGGWLIAQAPRERWRWAVGAAAFGFAVLIGLSRLYLGVHWPTDVLAGQAIAVGWLAVCLAGRHWIHRRGFFAPPA